MKKKGEEEEGSRLKAHTLNAALSFLIRQGTLKTI
jgi:hypothetical protein